MLRIALLSSVVFFSCNNAPAEKQPPVENNEWTIVFQDEFDYNGLPDSTKWGYDVGGHGWGNNELQFYTAGRQQNARVNEGMLTIEAHREEMQSKEYSSARLVTKGKGDWQYARIEVKAKLPKGRGTWPAIWMLASTNPFKWPDDGEIDIMEHVGYNQGYVHASIHTKKYNHIIGTQITDTTYLDDLSETFHRYQVEWNKDSMYVGIDDRIFYRCGNDGTGYEAWPFDNKMHLLLNIAVGGNWGGQKGVDESIWPQRMEVDYVRVWQKKQ